MPIKNKPAEHADPYEQGNPVPKVVMGLVLALVVWGVSYIFVQHANGDVSLGDQRDPAALAGGAAPAGAASGAQVFAARCQACHQATGKGLPGVFPPLAGSPLVTGDPAVTVQIVLHGLTGPVEVLGATYNGAMPAFAEQLGDDELAAVLSYVRSQWSNTALPIAAAAVAEGRKRSASRNEPWHGTVEIEKALAAPAGGAGEGK